eukprot:4292889-Alexandrium_andersonii.AAC.1
MCAHRRNGTVSPGASRHESQAYYTLARRTRDGLPRTTCVARCLARRSASPRRTKTGQRKRSPHGETRGRKTSRAGAKPQPQAQNFNH